MNYGGAAADFTRRTGAGAAGGGALAGPQGAIAGGMAGAMGKGEDWSNNLGFGSRKQKGYEQNAAQANENWYQEQQPFLQKSQGAGNRYLQGMRGATQDFQRRQAGINLQALPALEGGMQGAMTLQQAGDPNNQVQTAYRDLYNTEGKTQQGMFEQAGRNEMKQGQADAGVLSGLGAQAFANQLGSSGGPLTGGQMAGIAGMNMTQAGGAAMRAQGRMQALNQQGIEQNAALRGQGLETGRQESGQQYERGRQGIADWTNYQNQQNQQQFGLNSGMAGLQYGTQMDDYNRRQAAIANRYGGQMQQANSQADRAAAEQQGKLGFISGLAGAGAKAYAGGG